MPLNVKMDESLATTLVSNLLKNAYVHNAEGGEVRVHVGSDGLRVENTGAPTALDATVIFDRFYHTAGKRSSTGIGLSLVRAICRLYGFAVSYRFEAGRHIFEISKS